MKSKKLNKKLSLNKKTVANLSNNELNHVRGGDFTYDTVCRACNTEGIACRPTTRCNWAETVISYCDCISVEIPCP
jgi:natural product precursor